MTAFDPTFSYSRQTSELPIAGVPIGWQYGAMTYGGDDEPSPRTLIWRELPRWVKVTTVVVGLPAWLVFAAGIVSGRTDNPLQFPAFIAFFAVALLQLACLCRLFWRIDL